MQMKLTKYLFISAGYIILLLILWQLFHYSAKDYRSPSTGPDVQAQLNWIGKALRQGAGENTQKWYPEGYFFAHALYGYALVNQALLNRDNQTLVERNARKVEWVLSRLESEKGLAPFPREQAIEYGVFYQGWLNRLVGGLLLIEPNNRSREAQFHRQTEALAKAFDQSPTYQLEAYPGNCWTVDNVIAMTSLRLHDELYGTKYSKDINHWLDYIQTHLDPATGLIPHQINADTGEIIEGGRGSSQVLTLSFLPELDNNFAKLQYSRFRSLYTQTFLDFILVREYQHGSEGFGDVDSGPLIGGLSPVASGVILGTAHANGDEEIFERTLQLSEVLGVPIKLGDEKRFAFGQLVVGDEFLVWGKTITPWTTTMSIYEPSDYPRLTPYYEYWIFGIAFIISIALGLFTVATYRQP
jgi:hypothetical protein